MSGLMGYLGARRLAYEAGGAQARQPNLALMLGLNGSDYRGADQARLRGEQQQVGQGIARIFAKQQEQEAQIAEEERQFNRQKELLGLQHFLGLDKQAKKPPTVVEMKFQEEAAKEKAESVARKLPIFKSMAHGHRPAFSDQGIAEERALRTEERSRRAEDRAEQTQKRLDDAAERAAQPKPKTTTEREYEKQQLLQAGESAARDLPIFKSMAKGYRPAFSKEGRAEEKGYRAEHMARERFNRQGEWHADSLAQQVADDERQGLRFDANLWNRSWFQANEDAGNPMMTSTDPTFAASPEGWVRQRAKNLYTGGRQMGGAQAPTTQTQQPVAPQAAAGGATQRTLSIIQSKPPEERARALAELKADPQRAARLGIDIGAVEAGLR
jgi:hypothetical protein